MTVGFQGERGAFSEEAARALLGDVDVRGFRTFDDLVRAVGAGEVSCGLLPCENSIAGSIARAYDLLAQHPDVTIIDETTHAIRQCLIGVPGASLQRLTTIASHPVALEQCRRFLAGLPRAAVVSVDDTAGAVREMMELGDPQRGAIGPALAADVYGAAVLEHAIEDDPDNTTRFFVIAAGGQARRCLGRACLMVSLPHRQGSLHAALGVLARENLNLRSLVARPNRLRPFEYVFYLEFDISASTDVRALASELSTESRVLGCY
jgi:prephenate dehydratase